MKSLAEYILEAKYVNNFLVSKHSSSNNVKQLEVYKLKKYNTNAVLINTVEDLDDLSRYIEHENQQEFERKISSIKRHIQNSTTHIYIYPDAEKVYGFTAIAKKRKSISNESVVYLGVIDISNFNTINDIFESKHTYLLNTHSKSKSLNRDVLIERILTLKQKSNDDALEFIKKLKHNNEKDYKDLIDNLHLYSDNIPELLGDEDPDVVCSYLDDFSTEEINNILNK